MLQKVKDCGIFHFLYLYDYQYFIKVLSDLLKDRFCLSSKIVTIHLACVKFILMKKVLLFMMAFALPIFALEMRADDENAKSKIPLHLSTQQELCRNLINESIECHYFGMMNLIVTTVYSDLGDVALTVTNCSTGSVWYDTFDSALEPQTLLPLSGEPGIYEIVYVTESGDIYEGTFNLN